MNKLAIGLLLSTAPLTGGCIPTVTPTPVAALPFSVEQVRERNYVLGQARTVVVGEAVVRIKEFAVRRNAASAFRVENSAQYRMGMNAGTLLEGAELPIAGVTYNEGRRYRIANADGLGIQVADDGSIWHKGLVRNPYNTEWVVVLPDLNFTPAPPRLTEIVTTSAVSAPTDLNYEIVFTGTDGQSLRFQYREFTRDDMARPAFSQELTYSASAPRFRFRDLVVRIVRVGTDDLEYVVEAD